MQIHPEEITDELPILMYSLVYYNARVPNQSITVYWYRRLIPSRPQGVQEKIKTNCMTVYVGLRC